MPKLVKEKTIVAFDRDAIQKGTVVYVEETEGREGSLDDDILVKGYGIVKEVIDDCMDVMVGVDLGEGDVDLRVYTIAAWEVHKGNISVQLLQEDSKCGVKYHIEKAVDWLRAQKVEGETEAEARFSDLLRIFYAVANGLHYEYGSASHDLFTYFRDREHIVEDSVNMIVDACPGASAIKIYNIVNELLTKRTGYMHNCTFSGTVRGIAYSVLTHELIRRHKENYEIADCNALDNWLKSYFNERPDA